MPFPTPSLDDRKFQDIVDEAKRLIPLYCPEWTNHNVSDPGVALIELFAWMSEMVLYRVNAVPDRLYTHFLNLVGVEPFGAAVARADLTFWLSKDMATEVKVPAGTEVTTTASTTGTDDAIVFTTVNELSIKAPELTAALTREADDPGDVGVPESQRQRVARIDNVWDDLRTGSGEVACFSEALVPGDAMLLGFRDSLAGMVIRLDVQARAQGLGIRPGEPPLRWSVWSGEAWVTCRVEQDTTGGLNRDGSITLVVPRDHARHPVGNQSSYWLRVELLDAGGRVTYSASPRISHVAVAAIGGTSRDAENARVVAGEAIGRSNGMPGQAFYTSYQPILARGVGEGIVVVTPRGEDDEWVCVEDFSGSGPRDKHYVWEHSTGTIKFGPRVRYPEVQTAGGTGLRQHGMIPPDGAVIRVTGYRTGGGSRGNVVAGQLTLLRTSLPFVNGVTNLTDAIGGADAETPAEAKVRGPFSLRTGQRAVTVGDYERLALEASAAVARVRVGSAGHGNGAVRVLVVPRAHGAPSHHGIDDFVLEEGLLAQVREKLDRHRLVGTSLEVTTPYYQGVSVVARVAANQSHEPTWVTARNDVELTVVQQRAVAALTAFVHPLTGGDDGQGWPFDRDLNTARVTQLLESVEGVKAVDEVLLFEYDLRSGRRLGDAKDVIRLDPDSLFLSTGRQHQVVVR